MQQLAAPHMATAVRGGLALARRAMGTRFTLQRLMGGSKALRALSPACQLPHQRAETFAGPARSLCTTKAVSQAAAVDASPAAAAQESNGSTAQRAVAAGAPTFQEAIARLQEYWAGVGCALWLPHNTEVRVGDQGRLQARLDG